MFRLNTGYLPKDPEFPTRLGDLGYFIDTTDDCVKSIERPEEYFHFHVTNHQRYNEKRKEAVHAEIHQNILQRLETMQVCPLYLPKLAETKPQFEPSIDILTTPRDKLCKKQRVVVVVNRGRENLGVWAWRKVTRQAGIAAGSAVSFAEEINCSGEDCPGLIITNSGQLLYSHKKNKTMTYDGWDALQRPSIVHPTPTVDPVHNQVNGNKNMAEHVEFVFNEVIANHRFVAENAEIYVVGLGDGGDQVVEFLDRNWSKMGPRVHALALTAPHPVPLKDADFESFLTRRTRAWVLSAHPLDTPLSNAGDGRPYQCVAGGEERDLECIMPAAYKSILEWFETVAMGGADYQTETLELPEEVKKEIEERLAEYEEPDWS